MNISWINGNGVVSGLAMATVMGATVCLFYVYIGYPALMAVLAALVRRRSNVPGYCPSVSVLIAAYNEEASIHTKITQTLELNYPADKLEILVVSDGSTDRTDEIVRAYRDPRVRLLRTEGRKGKTNGQNEGVKRCRGEIVVFSDATAVYHPEALRYLASHYVDARVGAVSGRYKYFDANGSSPSGLGSIAFWNYENWIKQSQSQVGTLTGCSGCIYSVRKSAYVPLPVEACSDLVEPLNVVKHGYRVAFEPFALAYEETTESTRQEFRMRVRVGTRGMRGVLSVGELLNPGKHPWIAFQLVSHKVMRWLVPLYLLLLFFASGMLIAQPAFRLLFGLQVGFYLLAAASIVIPIHKYSKLLGLPLFFCTLNAAAAVSLFEVMRGHKYTTWETVRRDTTVKDTVLS
jgi:cellulose synthase/poly-beta-1,6-N-acetylglucosamine synthase-like glycosyltransferase